MACYCCLTNRDKVDIIMTNFGKITPLREIENSEFPQFIVGRILPHKDLLISPITGKSCVYYEAMAEELVEKSDDNGLTAYESEPNSDKVWAFRFAESKSSDFTLVDPANPSLALYVPGAQVSTKNHAQEDDLNAKKKGTSKQFAPNEKIPQFVVDFCTRHNYDVTGNKQGSTKKKHDMRFREASFEFGEQIAVLGIIKEITDEKGFTMKVLYPVDHDVLTEEYFEKKGWSDWDRRSLLDLTKDPSIIITDLPKYFQGIEVKKIQGANQYQVPESVKIKQDKIPTIVSNKMDR